MNELEIKILHEELARAVMINEAKKLLSEEEFSYFMNELKEYDKNLPLNESVEPQLLYEGLLDRLKNLAKGMVKKVAPDNLEKIDQLAAQLADVDMDLGAAKEVGRTPNEIKALETKRNVLLQQLAEIDPSYAQEAQKEVEKEDASRGGGGGKKMDAATAEKAKEQLDDIDDQLDTPKSRSIWTSIKRNYMAAFEFMPALLGAGIRKLNQIGRAKPQSQDDLLIQLLMMLLQQSGANQNVDVEKVQKDNEDKSEEPIQGGEGEEGGEGKPKQNKVADVQDKIILALNKVLDLVDLDLSRNDTQELAKKLTKNLVDQMVANGIAFKGMEAQVQETILRVMNNKLLTEQEEDAEKPKNDEEEVDDRVEKLIRKRFLRFSLNTTSFLTALQKVKDEFNDKEYGKKEIFRQYVNSPVEQEFVGLYDAYLDIMALNKAFKKLTKDGKENKQIAKALEKADQQVINVAGEKRKGRKLSSLVVHFSNFYRLASNDNQKPNHPAQMKKYRDLKFKGTRQRAGTADAKDMYKPEKIPDAELPAAKKGQINARNLAFQALKGMDGIEKDVRTDIADKLTKKLVGIAKQYIEKGMEINVVQEKLDRYAKSVIKELKNAM